MIFRRVIEARNEWMKMEMSEEELKKKRIREVIK
jgi:hypothetical protein